MENIQAMLKSWILFVGNLDEIFDKGVFWDCERLSNDDVVTIWE